MENDRPDPRTFVALLFRIVDEPRRTLAAAALLLLFMAAALIARLQLLGSVTDETLGGGGACIAVAGWLRHRAIGSVPGPERDRRTG